MRGLGPDFMNVQALRIALIFNCNYSVRLLCLLFQHHLGKMGSIKLLLVGSEFLNFFYEQVKVELAFFERWNI